MIGFSKPSDVPFPFDTKEALSQCKFTTIEKLETERALLSFFLARIAKIDPDLVVGHDLQGGDFDILVHRLYINKIPNWSRLGRLKRSVIPPPGKVSINVSTNKINISIIKIVVQFYFQFKLSHRNSFSKNQICCIICIHVEIFFVFWCI